MLGMVPVQVIGPCGPGDAIYASPDAPGVGIAEFNIKHLTSDDRDVALLGFAFQKQECEENEVCKHLIMNQQTLVFLNTTLLHIQPCKNRVFIYRGPMMSQCL